MNFRNIKFNEKLVIAATNYARKIMEVDCSLWVFINEGDFFKSINHAGMFQKDEFAIRYNRDWLKLADIESVIKCAFHETFHAVQYSALIEYSLGIKSKYFSDDEILTMLNEFESENYNDSIQKWDTYFVELQAEAFAIGLYELLYSKIISIDDFVYIYYDIYPNIE